jgi:Tol biopolymer transport system component
VVEEELAGRGAEIKEYVIGVQVYRKSESYDPRTDPTVRVDAGKLRARLAEYYATAGRDDPIVISIPKGTYVPCFESKVSESATPPVASGPAVRGRPATQVIVGALILMVACAVWGTRLLIGSLTLPDPATRMVALTSFPGEQAELSLSPDGSMVAFSWSGENSNNSDIYVKVVDATTAIRLTTGAGRDVRPAWSPDGRQIAFLRNPGPAGEVYVVSALGGPERRVLASSGESVGWTADSRNLLVMDRQSPGDPHAGYSVSLDTGERKQITFPPAGSITGDYDFAASPDGRSIAFCRMVRPPVAELWMMLATGGRWQKVTESRRFLRGIAWTPDGRNIVFSSQQTGFSALWSVKAEPGAVPSLLPGLESDAVRPSMAVRPGSLDRVAYQRREQPYRLWRAALSGDRMSPPQQIAPSQRIDCYPQISPDGGWLTFASDRAGTFDIWVSRMDGTGLRNLTAVSRLQNGAPRWSPDGTTIVFDAHGDDGNYDIYMTLAAGGPLRRLTWDKSEEVRPSWSADGKSIYFSSDRTGRREIWKMPSAGGTAMQMTSGGGFEAFESPDGHTLYYLEQMRTAKLWQMPSGGGTASLILDSVHDGRWAVTEAGILLHRSIATDVPAPSGRQDRLHRNHRPGRAQHRGNRGVPQWQRYCFCTAGASAVRFANGGRTAFQVSGEPASSPAAARSIGTGAAPSWPAAAFPVTVMNRPPASMNLVTFRTPCKSMPPRMSSVWSTLADADGGGGGRGGAPLPPEMRPRVVVRFAPESELFVSGMLAGGRPLANSPAMVDVPRGKGHVLLFANNPMWRNETQGSYFLLFNAMLNYDHLSAGVQAAPAGRRGGRRSGGEQ